jgi:hypothetical protein
VESQERGASARFVTNSKEGGIKMTKPAKPMFPDDVIALARDELRYRRQGDDFQCATMRSHGRDYVLARSNFKGRPGLFAIGEDGKVYPTQAVDGLFSVCDEPDCYHFDD